MRGLLAIMSVALLGCIAAVYSPEWIPTRWYDITPNSTIVESTPLHEAPTMLHEVDRSEPGDPITKFMMFPNSFQFCACMTWGEFISCYCTQPEIGVCVEPVI